MYSVLSAGQAAHCLASGKQDYKADDTRDPFPLRMANTFISGYFRSVVGLSLTATLPKVAQCIISLTVNSHRHNKSV